MCWLNKCYVVLKHLILNAQMANGYSGNKNICLELIGITHRIEKNKI